jgi:flagellar basal-body rod protein FlgF
MPDGQEAYTRDGGYVVDENGIMRTRSGLAILSDGGPITVPNNTRVSIGEDGTISAVPIEGGDRASQTLGQLKLVAEVDRNDFYKGVDGLFRRNDGQDAPRADNVRVTPGAVEGSNVNVVESLVQMIDHARHYDLNIKLMQTADQNGKSATSIMNLAG